MSLSGPPTIFLGSAEEEETTLGNPLLILVDNESEALYCVAVPSKAFTPWVVEYVCGVLCKLGYAGTSV